MSDRVRATIESLLVQNPFHADHYDALAQAMSSGDLTLHEALDVLARLVEALPDSGELARVVPLFEKAFTAILQAIDDPDAKREVLVGLSRVARDILKDAKRAAAHLAHAYKLLPDADLARELGLRGLEAFGPAWAMPYLRAHADASETPDADVLFKLAALEAGADDPGLAEQRLARVAEIAPEDARLGKVRAALDERLATISEEIDTLREGLDAASDEERPLLCRELGRYLLMVGPNSDEGCELLLTGLRAGGDLDAETLVRLDDALIRLERPLDAIDVLRARLRVEQAPTPRVEILRRLADLILEELSDTEGAVELLQQATSLDPRDGRIASRLQEVLAGSGNLSALATTLENALKAARDPEAEAGILTRLGKLYWKELDDQKAAERVYKRLRTLAPEMLDPLDFYQELYIGQRRYDNLFSVFSHKAELLSGSALVRAAQEIEGILEGGAGSPEKRLEIWKKVVRREPNHPVAAERYTDLLVDLGRWHSVIDFLKTRVKGLPDDQADEKISILLQIVDIFGSPDKLDIEDMCTNTWREILDLDPHHGAAIDALVERYRASGRYKDLARILLHKVEITSKVKEQQKLLAEILEIATKRVRDVETALAALEKLHVLDPSDAEVTQQLKAQYRQRKDHARLFALLKEELDTLASDTERRDTLVELAKMAQEKLGDTDETMRLLEQAADLDPSDDKIRLRLESIYRKSERWEDYARILRGRLDSLKDAGQRVALLDKLGKIYLDQIEDYEEAEKVFLEILELRPSTILTQNYLQRIYLRTRDWAKLRGLFSAEGNWGGYITTLEESLERGDAGEDTPAVLEEIARVHREQTANAEAERAALERLVAKAPGHLAALTRLREVLDPARDREELDRVLQALILASQADEEHIEVLVALMDLRQEAGDLSGSRDAALARLDDLIRASARDLLGRLRALSVGRAEAEHLRDALSERLAGDLAPDASALVLEELGALLADNLEAPDQAADVFQRLLEEQPGHAGAVTRLTRLYEQSGRVDELVGTLAHALEHESTASGRATLLMRLSEIAEEAQGDPAQAVRYLHQALDEDPRAPGLYEALERIHQERGAWSDLADLYLRRVDAAQADDERDSLRLSLAQLYATQLDRVDDAMDLLESLAQTSTLSSEAIGVLEELLLAGIEEERSWEFLEVWHEEHANWERLVELLTARHESRGEPELLRRVAAILDEHGGDPGAAFEARILALGVDASARADWDRAFALGRDLERDGEVFAACVAALGIVEQEGAARLQDEALENDLLRRLAALARDHLGDRDTAISLLARYREREPDDAAVLDDLIALHRAGPDPEVLLGLLREKLETSWGDVADKRATHEEIVALLEQDPAREPDLIEHVEALLELAGQDEDLVARLDGLYERHERHEALALLIRERELPALDDDDARLAAYLRLADLLSGPLGDPFGAVEALDEALAVDPARDALLDALEDRLEGADEDVRARVLGILEPICRDHGLHERLVRLLTVRAEITEDSFERAMLQDQIALVLEQSLDQPEAGLDTRLRALANHPTAERMREVFNRAGVLNQWQKLAAALHQVMEDPGLMEVEAAFLLGEVYLSHLDSPEEAAPWYERVREEDPTHTRALERLRDIYRARGDGAREVEALRALLEACADPEGQRDLLKQIAAVEERRGEAEAAEEAWREILTRGDTREDDLARTALERLRDLLRGQQRLDGLVDLLREQHAALTGTDARREVLYEIAAVQREAAQIDDAVATYREVLDEDASDPIARTHIEAILLEESRWDDYRDFLSEELARESGDDRLPALRKLLTLHMYHAPRAEERLLTAREILELDPGDDDALEAATDLLDDDAARADAFRFLDGFGRAQGLDELLDRVYRAGLAGLDEADLDRSRVLADLARLNHERLGQHADAADFAALWLKEAPLGEEPWALSLAICRQLESFSTLLAALDEVVEADDDPLVQALTFRRKASLLEESGDVAGADEAYERVLALDPEDREALDGQIALLRSTEGDPARLVTRLEACRLVAEAPADRAALAREAGALLLDPLDEPARAVALYELALEDTPDDADLYDLVASLHAQVGSKDEALATARRKLDRFGGQDDESDRALTHGLLARLVEAPERADEAKDVAVGLLERFGFDEPAAAYLQEEVRKGENLDLLVTLLDHALRAEGLHARLAGVYEDALGYVDDDGIGLSWRRTLRDLYEGELGAPDAALRCQIGLIRQDPGDLERLDRAEKLAKDADALHDLIAFFQEIMAETTDPVLGGLLGLRIARLFEGPLNEPEAAIQYYRLVLEREPGNRDAFEALALLYEVTEAWTDLALHHEARSEALILVDEKVAHLRQAYELARERVRDADMARSILRHIVDLAPSDLAAVETLEGLYRETDDVANLRSLYPLALDHLDEPATRATLRCRYAELLLERAEEYLEGIGQVEEALLDAPGLPEARVLLERVLDREYLPQANRSRILLRTIELLDGLYDADTDPEQRALLIEKKLLVAKDADQQIELLVDLSEVHALGTGDAMRAFDALNRAWRARPTDDALHGRLVELIDQHGLHENLAMVYADVLDESDDDDVLTTTLRRYGDLLRGPLARPAEAAQQLAIFNKRAPGDPEVLAFLKEHYRAREAWADLLGVIEEQARVADDEDERGALLLEAAEVVEQHLDDNKRLAAIYKQVLEIDPGAHAIAERLEGLLAKSQDVEALVRFYDERLEQVTDAALRVGFLKRNAQLRETTMGQIDEAVALLEEILSVDDTNAYALSSLERVYARDENHDGLVRILTLRRKAAADDATRRAIDLRLAGLQLRHLDNPVRALQHVVEILGDAPGDEEALALAHDLLGYADALMGAFEALEDAYTRTDTIDALGALYLDMDERIDDAFTKADLALKAATLAEEHSEDPVAALVHLGRAFTEVPERRDVRDRLLALVRAHDMAADAAALLPERVEAIDDAFQRADAARELGAFFAEALPEPAAAIRLFEIARAADPEEPAILTTLADLVERAGDRARLLELWQELADSPDLESARGYRLRLGEAWLEKDGTQEKGIEALSDLYIEGVEPARIAQRLAQVVDRAPPSAALLDLLERHYRDEDDVTGLVGMLAVRLARLEDPGDQASLAKELGLLCRDRLEDYALAFDYLCRAATLDPRQRELLPDLESLAEMTDQMPAVAEMVEGWISGVDDDHEREDLLRVALRLYDGPLASPADARRVLSELVSLVPHDVVLVDRLLGVYDEAGRLAEWLGVIWTRIEQEIDADRRATLFEAAAERAASVADPAAEIRALEGLLEADALPAERQGRLEDLYGQTGQQERVVTLLEKRLEHEDDPAALVDGTLHLAELRLQAGGDTSAVVALLERALDVDPGNQRALLLLAELFRAGAYWSQLADVLRRLVDNLDDDAERVTVIEELARLTADELQDLPGAAGLLEEILRLNPDRASAALELVRIRERLGEPEGLVRALNHQLRFEPSQAGQLALLTRCARIQALEMKDSARARDLLSNVLERDAHFRDALVLSAEIAGTEGRDAEARQAFERLLEKDLDGTTRARVLASLADLAWKLEDWAAARRALEEQVEAAPSDSAARTRLAEVLERQGAWAALAPVGVALDLAAARDRSRAAGYRRLAEIHRDHLGDDAGFERWIRRAYDTKRDSEDTVGAMIDFYRAHDRHEDLLPLLKWYVSYLETQRRPESFARFASELADALADEGRLKDAIEFRKAIKKQSPQDYPNLLGLGRLHYEQGQHDEAEKVLQLLLLKQHQLADPAMKAEMFLVLARIRAAQGDRKKALQYVGRVLASEPEHVEALELKAGLE